MDFITLSMRVCLSVVLLMISCYGFPQEPHADSAGHVVGVEHKQLMTQERDIANRLLHRLMDVAYETFKDLGGSESELKAIQQKRARITMCYFQAISCY